MVISEPNQAPSANVMMVSIMLHCLQYLLNVEVSACLSEFTPSPVLTNRAKIRHITDAVSVQFASAGAMIILVECALVVGA